MKVIKLLQIHYKRKGYEKYLEGIKKYYQNLEKIEDVISKASKGVTCQVLKHPHQRRIPNRILNKFSTKLISKKKEIQSVLNFQSLYLIIQQNRIIGIGDLTIYDTALRIGFYLRVYPRELYIQAGSKEGFKSLCNTRVSQLIIKPTCFCKNLKEINLEIFHLENFLCIYRNEFKPNKKIENQVKKKSCISHKFKKKLDVEL